MQIRGFASRAQSESFQEIEICGVFPLFSDFQWKTFSGSQEGGESIKNDSLDILKNG
jgi:hypothetical protein